ncbi:hypothetical protein F8388_012406 [Cannabis sativa]|uniref:Retrotransposon gag domain-containing protein n=1 Tax=Cannabis sativa TaxID=3483 RepID=A0A7J6H1Z3_CANSA|nr:hypothetical protein F8388_012406 [Cannabis sativa]
MARRGWPMSFVHSERARRRRRAPVGDLNTIGSWDELKLMLVRRFRSAHEGTIYDRFFALRQTDSVQEYRRRFESFAAAMGTMGDQGLQGVFVNGLRMEIQGPLRLLHPNGLIRAMELAESIEANQILHIQPLQSIVRLLRHHHHLHQLASNVSQRPN